jgi:adenosylcobyric acid synthase
MATPIMILGCTSDAGKSFLVTALCRFFANRHIQVAPFKAQNMSNNAAVTPDGQEIGRAQYLQALAARVIPQARMNPILLKPSTETFSQVIVMGQVNNVVSTLPWMERKHYLWPIVREALYSLLHDYEQLIIEGAGSPAEINLRAGDIVNMAVALECQADVYLVADIDRGGAFAHLLGTWQCLDLREQRLIKGFILNKFRGDQSLLGNAMEWLQHRTGVPTVAIIPMIQHALPEEDTLHHRSIFRERQINLALVAYPYASNCDEFDPLLHEEGVNVVPIRDFTSLEDYHAIILPGSKHTAASLQYIRQNGLAAEITRAAQRGIPVLGVCGGLQLLGQEILDPHQLESENCSGLGLLDVKTTLAPRKVTQQRTILWSGIPLQGYEIHHGHTEAKPTAQVYLTEGLGWRQGNVYGVYLHGLFENTVYRHHFLKQLGWRGQSREEWSSTLDIHIERAAQLISESGWKI